MSLFIDPTISLFELVFELVSLSQLSHMLLIINRRNGSSFMTSDLYLDIQSTIQDANVATAYSQIHSRIQKNLGGWMKKLNNFFK